jgi:uncharacterized protein
MMKWLRLGVALALGASGGWAVDWQARYPKPEGYVSDFARVIDPVSKKQIEAYAASIEQATGAHMAFVTIPSLETEPIEGVADAIFHAWGDDEKVKGNGILLLLSVAEHRLHLVEGSSLQPILPASLVDDLASEMRPALRKNDVGDAMSAAAETIGTAVGRARKVRLTARMPQRRHLPEASDIVNWVLVAGVIAVLWLFSRAPGPRVAGGRFGVLPWLLLGNLVGGRSSYGSRGSGGFGGFDSGDGFGAFGGGDCGHGRASSDW